MFNVQWKDDFDFNDRIGVDGSRIPLKVERITISITSLTMEPTIMWRVCRPGQDTIENRENSRRLVSMG